MNILVTGAAGFIGSALARRLVAEGHEVVGVDNFNDYYEVSLKRDRVAALVPDLTIVEGSIGDESLVRELFASYSFDAVCHLAAMAGVRYSIDNPQVYVENNLTHLVSLLEVMKEYDCTKMVFASSSSVYGNDTTAPFVESATAAAPQSVYGATKRSGELLLHTYHALYGFDVTALRFFTVYGPWSRPDMAMLKFATKIVKEEPIEVYNEGKLERDFTYIDDIVNGFNAAVQKLGGYNIYNLGNGKPVPLLRYVELLEEALNQKAKKTFLPMQPGDVFATYADTKLAQKELGFTAEVSIEEGVRQFVNWFLAYNQDVS